MSADVLLEGTREQVERRGLLWMAPDVITLLSQDSIKPNPPEGFDLVERQRKTGHLSNQFADLLAAAGLRTSRNRKSTGKGPGKPERCPTLIISQPAQDHDNAVVFLQP